MRPINLAAQTCKKNLERCCDLLDSQRKDPGYDEWEDWIQKRCVDFNMWCARTGVFAVDGRCSIDETLCLREEMQLLLSSFLHVFNGSVASLHHHLKRSQATPSDVSGRGVGQRKRTGRSGLLESTSRDAAQKRSEHKNQKTDSYLKKEVEGKLDDLVKATITIRESLPFSGLWQADATEPEAPGHEVERESAEPAAPTAWGASGLDHERAMRDIRYRLDAANKKRSHRLASGRGRAQQPGAQAWERPAVKWPPRSPRQRKLASEVAASSEKFERKMVQGARKLNIPMVQIRSDTLDSMKMQSCSDCPQLQRVSETATGFECPLCFHRLPAYFADPEAWREHALADFAPYTCVLAGCPQPLELYTTRDEWKDHMLNHPHLAGSRPAARWACPFCPPAEPVRYFDDELWLVDHIQFRHAREAVPMPPLVPAGWTNLEQLRRCSVCRKTTPGEHIDVLLNHVASCLQGDAVDAIRDFVQLPAATPLVAPPMEKASSTNRLQDMLGIPALEQGTSTDDMALASELHTAAESPDGGHIPAYNTKVVNPWEAPAADGFKESPLLLGTPKQRPPGRPRVATSTTPLSDRTTQQVIRGTVWNFSLSSDRSVMAQLSGSDRAGSRPRSLVAVPWQDIIVAWIGQLDAREALRAGGAAAERLAVMHQKELRWAMANLQSQMRRNNSDT